MDAATFLALAVACAPLVHPATAQAIVAVESGFNPHAIGVVAGSLERQPRNMDEALATARALQAQGRNFSVGLAQINVHNLDRLGLSLDSGFDVCTNLTAMQAVLLACHARLAAPADSQRALRQTLSCYYSGNLSSGIRSGYVRRVTDNVRGATRDPP